MPQRECEEKEIIMEECNIKLLVGRNEGRIGNVQDWDS